MLIKKFMTPSLIKNHFEGNIKGIRAEIDKIEIDGWQKAVGKASIMAAGR